MQTCVNTISLHRAAAHDSHTTGMPHSQKSSREPCKSVAVAPLDIQHPKKQLPQMLGVPCLGLKQEGARWHMAVMATHTPFDFLLFDWLHGSDASQGRMRKTKRRKTGQDRIRSKRPSFYGLK